MLDGPHEGHYHEFLPTISGSNRPLLRNQNLGIMRNREATVGTCRGRYLALLEGDDYWMSESKLQQQVEFLDTHSDYAICCHRAQVVDEAGTMEEAVFPSDAAGPYTLEDLPRYSQPPCFLPNSGWSARYL
jgi:hypothetical protein